MRFSKLLAFLFFLLALHWSFRFLMPNNNGGTSTKEFGFEVENALEHVRAISKVPHAVGFKGHAPLESYIVDQLERLGLEATIQEGLTVGDWGNLSQAQNIIARIKGTSNGKALLLLSHYDSSPHSSYGASDAGSGVATILEGARAFLEQGKPPKNDLIILISDAEELGLNGAELFVNEHPWAKDVGLVLNFEARGSGGPSYMLIETNQGNHKLIQEFTNAQPEFPVANSLAYSIYKMLPNDTDLTVFRKDGDINGFNFAFIDDHYDYHTALDTHANLDRNSLAHQASYLMPLLHYFANADLNTLKSTEDDVYFTMPFFKLLSYPFDWIWPMFILAILLFVWLLFQGLQKKRLHLKGIAIGAIPLIITLMINGLLGYFVWPLLKWGYPWYADILQGFTYNGHLYIAQMALCALAICLLCYHYVKKTELANLLVAPIAVWLLICGLAAIYLKGASFFIIPVFGLLAAWHLCTKEKKPGSLWLLVLALPGVFMHAPFIQMFPVGLGLKMLVAATLLTSLLFFLTLPFIFSMNKLKTMGMVSLLLSVFFGVKAHLSSSFSKERPKPSSLLYVYDADTEEASWASYDAVPVGWNAQFLDAPSQRDAQTKNTLSSKYNTAFRHKTTAPKKELPMSEFLIELDTVIGKDRHLILCVDPKRDLNRLEITTNEVALKTCAINGITLSDSYLRNGKGGKLATHYLSDNPSTTIDMTFAKDEKLELTFYEASNDLLTHPLFTVPDRPEYSIPMPFVLNDAILVIKRLRFE